MSYNKIVVASRKRKAACMNFVHAARLAGEDSKGRGALWQGAQTSFALGAEPPARMLRLALQISREHTNRAVISTIRAAVLPLCDVSGSELNERSSFRKLFAPPQQTPPKRCLFGGLDLLGLTPLVLHKKRFALLCK